MTLTHERDERVGAVDDGSGQVTRSSGLGRLPGLDGLRAVAVAAVVIFHLDVSLAPGGFMGVDIFFVISGFLITRLLTYELADTGRIRFTQFFYRRARRLFPAVLVLIAVVITVSALVWRDELATLLGSVLSSLGYVTNWWLLAAHQSYFVSVGRPPMLQHLWSLAIEEQFYLIWPFVIVLVARRWRRKSPSADDPDRREPRIFAIVPVAIVLALASTITMTLIARAQDVPYGASTSRVYFGSDTHSMGLFLGAAAGAWTVWRQRRSRPRERGPRSARLGSMLVLEVIALACLAGLLYAIATVDEYRPALYQGGFLLIDLLVLIVIMVVIRGGSALGRLLDCRPAVWVGRRSYSIYLWHWPVVLVTRPGIDVHGPSVLINLARIGIILLLADGSYRFVEAPLRARGLTRTSAPALPRSTGLPFTNDGRLALAGLVGLLCTLVLVAAGSPLFSGWTTSTHTARKLASAAVSTTTTQPVPTATSERPEASPATTDVAPPTIPASAVPVTSVAPVAPPAPRTGANPTSPLAMSAFGDSVLLGAGRTLAGSVSNLTLDAVEGRQASAVLADVVAAHARGSLAPLVLIDTGNNGVISPGQLNDALSALADRQRIILLTDRVPRDWQDPNNQTLRAVCSRFPNVVLIDWLHESAGHDGWFYEDGYHLNPTGAAAFTSLIVTAARQ